jgi:hypothetical protein
VLSPQDGDGSIRLAELVASLSLATDLGRGQPMEHCIRKTAIGLRLADLLGLGDDDRVATYYIGLLDDVYCHADAHEQAKWFGDDIGFKASTYEADLESFEFLLMVLRRLGAGEAGLARARRVAAFPARGFKEVSTFLHTHGRLQAEFAARIGLPRSLSEALGQSYERWDGKGVPDRIGGEHLPLPIRVVTLADLVEVHHRGGGVEAAREIAAARAGGHLDPGIVDVFREHADEVLAGLDETSSWDRVIGAEPGLARIVCDDELDDVLEAMADLVDMKSPWMAGHSRGSRTSFPRLLASLTCRSRTCWRSVARGACTISDASGSPTRSGTNPDR